MMTTAKLQYHLFALIVIYSLNQLAASEITYSITPDHDLCTVTVPQPCLSLSQFAANANDYLRSNTTLVFLPGIHYLSVILTVSSVEYFSMCTESLTSVVQVVCTNTLFRFTHSQHIDITSIEFIGCASNRIEHVTEFVLQNATFRSGLTMSGGVLFSVMSNIAMAASTFHSNVATWQGGVVRSRNSVITINACKFDNNTATGGGGGVLYLLYSSVKLRESDFNNSKTDFSGGVVYSQNSTVEMDSCTSYNNTGLYGGVVIALHSSVTIKASKLHHSSATMRGGVLDSHNSNITIQASEFDKNSAVEGGVLYSRGGSNVTVDGSRFSDNSASISGGVVYSLDSNVTIRECEFYNNTANLGRGLYSSGSMITIRGSNLFDNLTAAYSEGILHSSNSIIAIEPRLNISDDDTTGTPNNVNPSTTSYSSNQDNVIITSMIILQISEVITINDFSFISSTQTGVPVITSVPLTTTDSEVEPSKLVRLDDVHCTSLFFFFNLLCSLQN